MASLFAGSVCVNVVLLAWAGIRHGADSARYLASAQELLAGRWLRDQASWVYFGYNALLAFCDTLGLGEAGIIALQVFAAACAALALYDLGRQLSGALAGILAAGFFVIDYDIARWHLYVLTDSLFISLVVLSTWFTHRATIGGVRRYLEAAGVLLLTMMIRPNGWMLAPIAAGYWIVRCGLPVRLKWAATAAVLVAFTAGAASIAMVQFGRQAAQRGSGDPLPYAAVISPKHAFDTDAIADRLFTELLHARAEFSLRHNAMVIAMISVVYPLAVFGAIRTRDRPLARIVALVIAGQLFVVAVSFSDPDGRYLLYILPLISVFAACGAVALRDRWWASG